ncbi:MAG TPA: alkaline phosphatase family protein [Candidatus Baltobacteraceae bacterium]|jgi:phospholipase C
MRQSILALPVLAVLTACAGASNTVPSSTSKLSASDFAGVSVRKYIKHVVIIVQENRSFDNIFANFPGAESKSYGYMSTGTRVSLQPIPFEKKYIDHYYRDAVHDYDGGKMDGFDLQGGLTGVIGAYAYSYLDRPQVEPYWRMAKRYVLADHMFPTMMGPSFTAHLTLIAGTADLNPTLSEIDVPSNTPWGCDAPNGTKTATLSASGATEEGAPYAPCFQQFNTMAATLDAKGVSWKYYAPQIGQPGGSTWSSFDAIQSVRYSSDWTSNVVSPPTRILTDAARGQLPSVSWVIPDALWSDHPDQGTDYGPSWVASVVNAVGESKDWNSSAIIVVWDDWGGFYDDLPPPQLDFRGLGIRVPCLIISPYVTPHVEHTQYEFSSVLKFVEQVFGLPALGPQSAGYTDTRATSLAGSFDFGMSPRRFRKIKAKYPPSFFLQHAPSLLLPDDE